MRKERNGRRRRMTESEGSSLSSSNKPQSKHTKLRNNQPGDHRNTESAERKIWHFKGYILDWIPFWESFNDAIHSSSLSNVQKHHFVNNLELTDADHKIAIYELKKVNGEKGVLIDAHFRQLDTLQPVKDENDVAALWGFQINLRSNRSALETLGVP